MATEEYMTTQTYSATIGGVVYNVTASLGGIANTTGMFVVTADAYGAVGDGSNDDTGAIQSAINAAEVSGGVVYFPPGTYKITSTLNIDGPGVTLTGSWSAAISTATNISHVNIENGGDNTVVENLSFVTAAVSGFTAGRAAIDINSAATGTVNNVMVRGCRISGVRTGGIGGEDVDNVVITGNTLEDIGEHGIYFAQDGDRVVISNNVLDGVNSTTTAHSGIKFVGDNAVISGNHIIGYTDASGSCSGILIEDATGSVTVAGNLIDACREGMRIIDSSNISISGNTFTDCVLDGYYGDITMNTAAGNVDNISITGNTFFRSIAAGNGVPVEDVGTGTLAKVVFANNVINGNYAGDWRGAGSLHGSTNILFGFNYGGAKIPSFQSGTGSPNTVVTAPKGSLYSDYTNATLYQNDDGSTAWTETKT
jgi:parallel beta-helix repeat protein